MGFYGADDCGCSGEAPGVALDSLTRDPLQTGVVVSGDTFCCTSVHTQDAVLALSVQEESSSIWGSTGRMTMDVLEKLLVSYWVRQMWPVVDRPRGQLVCFLLHGCLSWVRNHSITPIHAGWLTRVQERRGYGRLT